MTFLNYKCSMVDMPTKANNLLRYCHY